MIFLRVIAKMKINYILHEREDLIRNIPVYKIGRTDNLVQRKRGYYPPK